MAFFSGTDVNTLLEEGSDLNHFLSLIVCNAGQYVARITRKLRRKIKAEALITYTESTEYKTFEDVNVVIAEGAQRQETKVEEKDVTCVEFFEMRINKTEVPEPFKELDERLDEIKRNKSKVKYSSYGGYNGYSEGYQPSNKSIIFSQYELPYQEPIVPTIGFSNKEEPEEKEVKNPNQTELAFEGQEEVEKSFNSPSVPVDNENGITEFYQFEEVPFNIVNTLCTQLLTGSILATSKTNLNLSDWVKKMDKLYEARFGKLTDSYSECMLRNWIQSLIDVMLCYSVDKKYEDKIAARYNLGDDYDYNDSDAFIHLYAWNMIDYLEELPKSAVKDIMIEELISLMPKEYDDLRDNS